MRMKAINMLAMICFALLLIGINCGNCTTGTGTLTCTNIITACTNITKKCTNTSINCTNNTYICTNTTGVCTNFTAINCTNATSITNTNISCSNSTLNCTNGTINCTNVTTTCSNITKTCTNITCPPCNNLTCINSPIPGCSTIDITNTLKVCNTSTCGCLTCNSTYALNANRTCTACNTLTPYCSSCTNLTTTPVCTLCDWTYAVNSTKQCQLCTTRYVACANCDYVLDKCTYCHYGYYYNLTSSQCQLCVTLMANCYRCSSATNCQFCYPAYGFNSTYDCVPCLNYLNNCTACYQITTCQTCVNNSIILMINSSRCGTCQEAIIYCATCQGNLTCLACNQSYLGVNYTSVPDTCVLCNLTQPNCLACSYYTYCLSCKSTYFLSYVNSYSQNCLLCSSYLYACSTCSNQTYCTSCFNNSLYLLSTNTHTCATCGSYILYCVTCAPPMQCLTCLDKRYVLTSAMVCKPCSNFMGSCSYCDTNYTCNTCSSGKLMIDKSGCTNVVGCIKINPPISPNYNCIICDSQIFLASAIRGICVCIQGWIIGNYCTTIIGCTSLIRINKNTKCIACNFTKKFVLKSGNCACATHYQPYLDTCKQICGDGFVIYLPCDDGNLINGDGCSSTCQIEPLHICQNNNAVNPSSKCQLKSKVQISLYSIAKTSDNTATITLNISPYSSRFQAINLQSTVTLSIPDSNVTSMQIIDGQLVIQISYNQTIEHQMGQLTMNFDRDYVISPSIKLEFQMVQTSGQSFIINQSTEGSQMSIMGLLVIALSVLSLIVFAVGSVAFKMIGVETLYTVQISWMILITSQQYDTSFAILQKMYYSYGQISRFAGDNKAVGDNFSKLGYTENLSENYLLLAVINSLAILLYIGASVYRFKIKSQVQNVSVKDKFRIAEETKFQKRIKEKKIKKLTKFLSTLYNWVLFPLFIGFLMHFIHTTYVNTVNNLNNPTTIYYSFNILLSSFATGIIFHVELFKINSNQEQEKTMLNNSEQNLYIPYFLIHNFLIFMMLTSILVSGIQIIHVVGLGFLIIHIIYLIIKRPYQSIFHNISIIFNQFVILFSLLWASAKTIFIGLDTIAGIIVFVYMGLILIVNVLGTIRSVVSLKQTYWNKDKRNEKAKKKVSKNQLIDQFDFNRSRFQVQQSNILTNMLVYPKYRSKQIFSKSILNEGNKLSFLDTSSNKDKMLKGKTINNLFEAF